MARRRLDAELVRRGLVASRARAKVEIEAGRVTVGGAPTTKPNRLVDPGEALVLLGPPPRFVSRGGDKLDAALDAFAISVEGRRVLDAGASTGGFTDCVLQRGAAEVIALDVGHGQLHERLVSDSRVRNLERTNLRDLTSEMIGGLVDLVVVDMSFISLRLVVDQLLGACAPGGPLVLLVKPQFEAGRAEADRSAGVITDPMIWRRVLDEVISAFDERGATIMGVVTSPITGTHGNVEFLVHVCAPDGVRRESFPLELDAVIDTARELKVR